MEKSSCSFCTKIKTAATCEQCNCIVCKKCSYFTDEMSFEYLSFLPEELQNKIFCPDCYNNGIDEKMELAQEHLEKARNVDVYLMNQTKETRLMDKRADPLFVTDCDSLEDALMHLAFLAAQLDYNTLINVDLKSRKEKISGNHKRLIWNGTGIPLKRQKR